MFPERAVIMKPINKDELFDNLHSFLKTKGVELREGSYKTGIQNACGFLAETVNLGQQGLERAKVEMDKRVDQMRQYIHEQTAPRSTPHPRAKAKPASPPRAANPKKSAPRGKAQKKATRR
jgi:hypothetical protein